MGPTLAAQLVYARPVMARHGEDNVGLLDEVPREQAGPVTREIEPVLQGHEIGAF